MISVRVRYAKIKSRTLTFQPLSGSVNILCMRQLHNKQMAAGSMLHCHQNLPCANTGTGQRS